MQIDGYEVHPDVTLERVMSAVQRQMGSLDDPGFCLACGCEVDGVEPDAEKYECESCGCPTVYGAEQVLLHMG